MEMSLIDARIELSRLVLPGKISSVVNVNVMRLELTQG
jgi:hypothetical protein